MSRIYQTVFLLSFLVFVFLQIGNSEATSVLCGPSISAVSTVSASIHTATGNGDIDICVIGCSSFLSGPTALTMGESVSEFPFGLVEFTLGNCDTASPFVMLTYTGATDLSGYTYRKYGPTPDKHSDHWYDFTFDPNTLTGAIMPGTTVSTSIPAVSDPAIRVGGNAVLLLFRDGLRGDDDLTVNGIIVDQGGPALPVVPALGSWGAGLLALLAGLAGLFVLRRKRAATSVR